MLETELYSTLNSSLRETDNKRRDMDIIAFLMASAGLSFPITHITPYHAATRS